MTSVPDLAIDAAPDAPRGAAEPLVRIENLAISFPHAGVQAVHDLSLTIDAGRCVALVGESGSGKSVTARSLLGLVGRGSVVTADALALGGRDLRGLGERAWRELRGRDVGYVLQDALVSLDPLSTVGAEIGEALRTHTRLRRSERRRRVLSLLDDVGIPDPELRLGQYPHQLSGGLRQRALIASALSASPGFLIADEPTTALDVTVQAQIIALLERLKSEGTALLLVSHDLAVVGSIADEILVMHDGRVVERGTPDDILGHATHPYTQQLLAAVPSAHARGERLSRQPRARFSTVERDHRLLPPETSDAAPPLVEARRIGKTYPGRRGETRRVLDDVSFTIETGRTLGVVGESGSGKSTAAHIVLGLTEPDSGEVLLGGRAWTGIAEAKRRDRRPGVQAIYQDPLSSFEPRYDVRQVVGEALQHVGVARSDRTERTVELLEQVGLSSDQLHRHPLELSGGQRQRVAIARALATGPELIICDEPVSALDASVQAQVLDLLSDLQEQTGVALLFISHDLGVVQHLAHDVVVMREGRIVESGTTEQVFTSPRADYTRLLLDSIPTLPRVSP